MRKVFIFFVLVFLLMTFITAETSKVGDAQTCLKDKIDKKTCSELSIEEKIFSLLAVDKCKSELLDDSKNKECWPKSNCNTKITAQAILALDNADSGTKDAVSWLLQNTIPSSDLIWYLQIDSSEPTTCQISYDSNVYNINIQENKKIRGNLGNCLTLAQGDYWLKVKSQCFRTEFSISCDERFSTSLLYKEKLSSIIYVLGDTSSASSGGETKEKINSLCFTSRNELSCDYETSLWAVLALRQKGRTINKYLPYLISMADENEKYLPESFLYKLTNSATFYEDLTANQVSGYWDLSGDKFYDTAVALYSMRGNETDEKKDAITWLLGVQDNNGCWKGIRETAFLLHAGWQEPAKLSKPVDDEDDDYIPDRQDDDDDYDDDDDTDTDEETNYLPVILVLAILIILTIIGIIFRDKLRHYWFRIKSGFGGGESSQSPPPGFLPPAEPQQRLSPRRILPRQSSRPRTSIRRKPKTATDKEFSDVLKKLKDMGG